MNSLIIVFLAAAVGGIGGLHVASLSAVKDSFYEPFNHAKLARTIIVGLLTGPIILLLLSEGANVNLGVLFTAAVAIERITTEFYKSFLRREGQEKYRIPSLFHVNGTIVEQRPIRMAVGITLAVLLIGLFCLAQARQYKFPLVPGLMWGFLGGTLTAIGGAWKDAPFEGFDISRFIRSPLLAAMMGILLSSVARDGSILLVSSVGAERMLMQLVKARTAPGKFKAISSAPIIEDPVIKSRNRLLMTLYGLSWVVFGLLLAS